MTDRWRWILMLWHEWRAAVWNAETMLYPVSYDGDLITTPCRRRWADAMFGYHHRRAKMLHDQLFPPPPIDLQEELRKLMRRQR